MANGQHEEGIWLLELLSQRHVAGGKWNSTEGFIMLNKAGFSLYSEQVSQSEPCIAASSHDGSIQPGSHSSHTLAVGRQIYAPHMEKEIKLSVEKVYIQCLDLCIYVLHD